MTSVLPLYIASQKTFLRDRMALFWTLAFPVLFILLFGVIFSGSGQDPVPVGVVQPAGAGGAPDPVLAALNSIPALEVRAGTRAELMDHLGGGDLRVVVDAPPSLAGDVAGGRAVEVEVIFDPTSAAARQIAVPVIGAALRELDGIIRRRPALITTRFTTVTADRLRTIDFLVPGILAMALMQLGLFGTAAPLVQLRERQVLRRLGATPLPRSALLLSQLLHRLTIALAQVVIIVAVGRLVFGVEIGDRIGLLACFCVLGALTFVSLGYLIAALSKTEESVFGITSVLNFPMMFLSGIFFPLEIMPDWIRPVVQAIPLTYLVDALRQTMVGAPPVHALGLDALVLGIWLAVAAVLSVRLFRWE